MKKKIVSAKLSLKKKIISPLSIERGNQVVGGAITNQATCDGLRTCGPEICPVTAPMHTCEITCTIVTTTPGHQIC
ncbi:class I lanthipeptide [Pedobacter nutrimenti]|uniref:class I lanthipeptide n=1 Tax=Pedobacter nutrimenti TaxID=1241337 RepID=UPI003977338A